MNASPSKNLDHYLEEVNDREPIILNCIYGDNVDLLKKSVDRMPAFYRNSFFKNGCSYGENVLSNAVRHNARRCVNYLLSLNQPGFSAHYTEDGTTLLHMSCHVRDGSMTEFMLSKNIPINAIDRDEQTALHWACEFGNKKAAELLINHGANPFLNDKSGYTPFDFSNAPPITLPSPGHPAHEALLGYAISALAEGVAVSYAEKFLAGDCRMTKDMD